MIETKASARLLKTVLVIYYNFACSIVQMRLEKWTETGIIYECLSMVPRAPGTRTKSNELVGSMPSATLRFGVIDTGGILFKLQVYCPKNNLVSRVRVK